MKAKIFVTLKNGVLDPQGKAIEHALHSLGFPEVGDVRQGKFFEMSLSNVSRVDAEKKVKTLCEKLLANLVIEDFSFEIKE